MPCLKNPFEFTTKLELYEYGKSLAEEFLDHNDMPHPKFRMRRLNSFGLYSYGPRTVTLNVQACRWPSRGSSYSWSYPGWKADVTPVGVVCHEVGHHVWQVLGRQAGWKAACQGKRVSGYEPCHEEAFAETVRLFITNPDLLRKAIPSRYDWLVSRSVKPVALTPWRKVLRNAHERYITTGEKWIERRK